VNGVGILAYGSLIDDPGCEIEAVISHKLKGVQTPFNVEFARKSSTGCNAPTLVPVKEGGAQVKAVILVLEEQVSVDKAKDMLWRRETNQIGSSVSYRHPIAPNQSTVLIEGLDHFEGIGIVIYTRIAPNISPLTPAKLAALAIESALSPVGLEKRDGINYLISAKRNGILTPLSDRYEKEILNETKSRNLQAAWQNCRDQAHKQISSKR